MRLALITVHYANSYGGILQAFSTYKLLSKYGSVSIIDYRNRHLCQSMRLIRLGRNPRSILWAVKDMFRLLPRSRLLSRFKSFSREHFRLTRTFTMVDEMINLEDQYDIFVSGSDQIWNPRAVGDMDAAYLLSFVKKKKKISYASSAGSYRFSSSDEASLKKYLKTYSHLSVREMDTSHYLSALLGGCPVSHVLDPTLMMSRNEWLAHLGISERRNDRKYLLVYTLKKDSLVREVVRIVAERLGVRVIAVDQDPYWGDPVDDHRNDASPRDFVELFAGAAFVVTNSFHGTAFAANFGVPFLSVRVGEGQNRITGVLEALGLLDRLVQRSDDVIPIMESDISWKSVEERLEENRKSSLAFLDIAIRS